MVVISFDNVLPGPPFSFSSIVHSSSICLRGQFFILCILRHASSLLSYENTFLQAMGGHLALTGLREEAYGETELKQRSLYQMSVMGNRFFGPSVRTVVRISYFLPMLKVPDWQKDDAILKIFLTEKRISGISGIGFCTRTTVPMPEPLEITLLLPPVFTFFLDIQ